MTTWQAFTEQATDLAVSARSLLDAHVHKTLATLRADGSPRISGTEATFAGADLWLGCMAGSRKVDDLRRDPRCALHSGSDDPPGWRGDAKVSARAVEVVEPDERAPYLAALEHVPDGPFSVFRLDVTEVVVTRVPPAGDRLVIDWWTAAGGRRQVERT